MEARRAARGTLSAVGALVLVLAPAAQARKPLVRDEMRNTRYCEVFTVDLAPPPAFTDVRIDRRNTWTWDAGKKVFELVAPSGCVYAMQSYSRQVDPSLTYSDLSGLRPRLGLPAGWTYRVRRPAEDLVLITNGRATITQDALRNTYQRLPRGLTRSSSAARRAAAS